MNTIGLQFAQNMLGALKPELIKRVQRFISKPTFDRWDDISSIIISPKGRMKTIWNAVIDIDPFFPVYGRRTNTEGDILREWERIPTPQQVIEAINNTVFKLEKN